MHGKDRKKCSKCKGGSHYRTTCKHRNLSRTSVDSGLCSILSDESTPDSEIPEKTTFLSDECFVVPNNVDQRNPDAIRSSVIKWNADRKLGVTFPNWRLKTEDNTKVTVRSGHTFICACSTTVSNSV